MDKLTVLTRNLLAGALISIFSGCNEKEDPASYQPRVGTNSISSASAPATSASSEVSYPRVRGKWSGTYYRTDETARMPLKATIQQDNDAIVITTTKSGGTAVNLTGSIRPSGRMELIDAFDGEKWTTYFGPATENHIVIADFVHPPGTNEANEPLYVVDLNR